ncbi:hypothetical protein [Methylocella tundrae]|uniref:hypothetical protein n=1 Tax=Methylocella tundrae TaxID=227605 RepID=UPI00157B6CD4|nr:hypothetical protein [Methylocella tundrae]
MIDLASPKTADATVALVLGAAVEQALEIAISTHFVLDRDGCARMFEDEEIAPIPTFAAKIRLAYALGIYEKHIRDELNLLKGIRNAFAHAKADTKFTDKHIAQACGFLWLPQRWHPMGPPSGQQAIRDLDTPREKFVTSAQFLFMYLEHSDNGEKPKSFSKSGSYSPLAHPGT